MLRSLQGKIPGVNISASAGDPGGATRIPIRGNSSFTGNNQPLFIVDGIPYSNDQYTTTRQSSSGGNYGTGISTLDPNSIETVTVLKGAAASAMYGSRAANGVILVTTKSGASSKKGLEIDYNTSLNWEQISNLPDYQNTYGNGTNFNYVPANGSWGARFDSRDSIPLWNDYANAFPEMGDNIPWQAYPDNVKNLFDIGFMQEHSLSMRGGNENSSLSATASWLGHDGYIPHSTFGRSSISLGGTHKLNNGIVLNGNFSYSKTNQVGGIFGNNQSNADGVASSFARTLWLGRAWDMDLPYEDPATGGPLFMVGGQADNPLWSWKHNQVISDMDRTVGGLNITYPITDWLSASYQFGVNTLVLRRKQIVDIGSRAYDGVGAIITDNVWSQEIESNFLLTAERDITPDLNIKVVAGHNVNQFTRDRQALRGRQIISPGIYDLDNTAQVAPFGGDYMQRRLWAVFGDVSLGYKNYLYLNLTARNDWSSTLPEDNRSYLYYSASSSFIFMEAFNIGDSFLDFGKIRLGYAKVGNDAPAYFVYDTYTINGARANQSDFPFNGQAGMTAPDVGAHPGLKPEFTTEFEVGTELNFFKRRIGVNFTYYDKKTTDQIAPISLPRATGYYQAYDNFGEVRNSGYEVGLDLTPIKLDNSLTWNIYTNFTQNKNEVISLIEGMERIFIGTGMFTDMRPTLEPGMPYGYLRGTMDYRDDEGNLLIDPGSGELIQDTELGMVGDPNPDFKLGLTTSLSFKGITLRAVLDYTHGGDVYSTSIYSLLGRGVTKDTEDRERTVIIPGYLGDANTGEPLLDADGNKIPNNIQIQVNTLYFGETFAINSASEWNVFDATVFHLRELSIGYELPKELFTKLPIGSINVGLSARNLWFFAPNVPEHTNFDPEINTFGATNVQGIEYSSAPSVKRYGFNLSITF